MFKLIHISDVHLPLQKVNWTDLLNKRLTGFANWHLGRKNRYSSSAISVLTRSLLAHQSDHIAVTGDLVNLGLPEENIAAARYLDALGKPDEVTAICGNHDAYIPSSLQDAIQQWGPYLSGDDAPITNAAQWPILRVRNNIAIIGCNSAEATSPFMATGYFRQDQAKRLKALLQKTKDQNLFRVVMIHHPPIENATKKHKRLIGQERFAAVIKEAGADIILHGHTHLDTRYSLETLAGDCPVICVPSLANRHGNSKPAGGYNLLNINTKAKKPSVILNRYQLSADGKSVELIETLDL